VKAKGVGDLIGYTTASVLPGLVYLLSWLNGYVHFADDLLVFFCVCPSFFLIGGFLGGMLVSVRKPAYVICMALSVLVAIWEGLVWDPVLKPVDLAFVVREARYKTVLQLLDDGALSLDPAAGSSYVNPERSYRVPKEFADVAPDLRVQLTQTEYGRIVAFYSCGIALSRCSARVFLETPGMTLPAHFAWPHCRSMSLGQYPHWLFCVDS
jgi:hypothetical protein